MAERAGEADGPEKAKTYQVERYLLDQIEELLSGKEQRPVVIISYGVEPEGLFGSCLMPETTQIRGRVYSVPGYSWFFGAARVLRELGNNLHDVIVKFRKDFGGRGWAEEEEIVLDREEKAKMRVLSRETVFPIEPDKLRGRLAKLSITEEFELVAVDRHLKPLNEKAKEIVREGRGWQILVRKRKGGEK